MFSPPASHAEAGAILCPGKQKHATTVYHVIWAELSDDTLTLSFVEKQKKKTRTVCIRARLWGGTKEEAAGWVEELLNVAYKGAIPTLGFRERELTSPTPDVKRNRRLKVLVNPFSGKVSYPFHLCSECLAIHPESEPITASIVLTHNTHSKCYRAGA